MAQQEEKIAWLKNLKGKREQEVFTRALEATLRFNC